MREIPGLGAATVWLIPESNLAGAAGMHVLAVQGLKNVKLMHEDSKRDCNGEKQVGFRTDYNNKRLMALQAAQSFSYRRIRLYEKFVTVGRGDDDLGRSRKDIKIEFANQLKFFTRLIYPAKDPTFGVPKERLSGKFNGKKDDMVLAFLICHMMISTFLREVRANGEYLSGQI